MENCNGIEAIIDECLTTKRMGFKEIPTNTVGKVLQQAPEGETFIVPDERKKKTYEYIAKIMRREDLKFELEDEIKK